MGKGDHCIFQQILLNILTYLIKGTSNAFINITVNELTMYENKIYLPIEIENCKFVLNKKDNIRIY